MPLAAAAGLIVIWPFWAWGRAQSLQVPIDHLSRHNFLADPAALAVFFLPMYGPLMFLIPFALWKSRQRRFMGLGLAFLPLFLLGLGGTTPLPRLLFGAAWEWLTYDRFALWASLVLLPFLGVAMLLIRRRLARQRAHRWASLLIYGCLAVTSVTIGYFPTLMPAEPAPIDMQPIVNFLAHANHSEWRYLTFGFGDQFAYLSRLTKATTIDGSYHSARSLPELRSSGIAQIDSVYWSLKGLPALDPILQKSGEHGVRWGFVSLAAYVPVLERNGWFKLTTLGNGVQVWENPGAVLPGPSRPPPDDPLASLSWGVFPLFSLMIAAALGASRFYPQTARKVLFGIHQFAVALLPLGLCFWYFIRLPGPQIARVYFVYTQPVLFLSDGLALIAWLSWFIARFLATDKPDPAVVEQAAHSDESSRPANPTWERLTRLFPLHIERWLLAMCLLGSLSVLWSVGWQVSLYASLQLWLVFGLFLSLRDRPQVWRPAVFGFCAALALQILIGAWQFAAQSTAFMKPLGLNWPGNLNPAMRGASVVQLLDGTRWLRVYGSFPHPNILAGVIIAFLAGPAALFLTGKKPTGWPVLVFLPSVAVLVLTFSRSAWLGLAAAGLVLVLHRMKLNWKRVLVLGLAALAGLLLAAVPLYNLIFTRVGGVAGVSTEEFSTAGRLWLTHVTFGMIRSRPVLGVGLGSYLVEYVQRVPRGYLVEPVHNLALLVVAELGIAGGLVLIGLAVAVLIGVMRARRAETIVFSAALIGLLTTGMFDHYLWTLAPGRLLLGLLLGLWAGQVRQDIEDKNAPDPH